MARSHKVAWFEGMTLDPHHFQQTDRFHQAALNFRLRSRLRYDWGFEELQINKDDLAAGQFSLNVCKGVSPDGLMFNMPEEDRLPKARALNELFAATAEKLEIFLAIRLERPGGSNCQLEPVPGSESRFAREFAELRDDNTGVNERAVGLARPQFQLRAAGEPLDEYSTLKIAEVVRTAKGTFALSERYIPPCLAIGASENLIKLTSDLLGRLVSKAAEQRGQLPFGRPEFTANELTSLWLSQTINTFTPVINHHLNAGKCSPEELYLTLLALGGELMTYPTGVDVRPVDFPRYDHNNLTHAFNTLAAQMREQLERIRPSLNYVNIALEKSGEFLWFSQSIPEPLLQTAQLYLIASGDVEERRLVDEFPRKLKMATKETIHALAMAAINGLKVAYTPRPPAGLPSGAGLHYFHLEKAGDFWESICRSRTIGILVPADFMKLKLELIALKQQ